MQEKTKKRAVEHAVHEYPKESCGLVCATKTGQEIYRPCENISEIPNQFKLSASDWAKAESTSTITRLVHSHPNHSAKPSEADKRACRATNIPWSIFSVKDVEWSHMEPQGYRPGLIGRTYEYLKYDCYTLVQDYYRHKYQLMLPSFAPSEDFYTKGSNYFLEQARSAGFEVVDDLKDSDLLLIQIGAREPNHIAIFLESGDILHHAKTKLSCREPYTESYRKRTQAILRHRSLRDL